MFYLVHVVILALAIAGHRWPSLAILRFLPSIFRIECAQIRNHRVSWLSQRESSSLVAGSDPRLVADEHSAKTAAPRILISHSEPLESNCHMFVINTIHSSSPTVQPTCHSNLKQEPIDIVTNRLLSISFSDRPVLSSYLSYFNRYGFDFQPPWIIPPSESTKTSFVLTQKPSWRLTRC